MTDRGMPNGAAVSWRDNGGIRPAEVLYSRTDSRGIIRAANAAFARVSGHPREAMIGAPHQLLRHPLMPRALFHVLWRGLALGQPAAAYLRNRTADGGTFLAFAIFVPFRDGFISVQVAPQSPLLQDVEAIYASVAAREAEEGADPTRSAAILHRLALGRGFTGYNGLAACALGQELALRSAGVEAGASADVRARGLADIGDMLCQSMREQVGLIRNFEALQLIPNNMRIVASRLEPAGGPISAISENYESSSAAISQRLRAFVGADDSLCERVSCQIGKSLMLLSASRWLSEADLRSAVGPAPSLLGSDPEAPPPGFASRAPVTRADGDASPEDPGWAMERRLLEGFEQHLHHDAREALRQAEEQGGAHNRMSMEIRRHLLGLDTIRVLGRVECSRMQEAAGLATTMDHLDAFHAEIKAQLQAITRSSERINVALAQCLRGEGAAA